MSPALSITCLPVVLHTYSTWCTNTDCTLQLQKKKKKERRSSLHLCGEVANRVAPWQVFYAAILNKYNLKGELQNKLSSQTKRLFYNWKKKKKKKRHNFRPTAKTFQYSCWLQAEVFSGTASFEAVSGMCYFICVRVPSQHARRWRKLIVTSGLLVFRWRRVNGEEGHL